MNLLTLIIALIFVESGGNDLARGPNGELGCLQMKTQMVDDVNRILGYRHFSYDDRLSRYKSVEMCQIYLTYYTSRKRLGRPATYQDAARMWNGGPDGYRERDTVRYWIKVRRRL